MTSHIQICGDTYRADKIASITVDGDVMIVRLAGRRNFQETAYPFSSAKKAEKAQLAAVRKWKAALAQH